MGLSDTIKIIISGDSEKAKHALREAQSEAGKTGHSFGAMAKVAAGGFVALAAGAIEMGREAVKAAELEETAHAKLTTALKNAHESWTKNKDAIEAADKAGEHFGYTAAETEAALAQGETSTGSLTKTVKELGIAQDLTAEKGGDLEANLLAVTKAGEGQLKPLKALGIDLPVAAGGALKVAKAQDALTAAQKRGQQVAALIHSGQLKGPAAAVAYAKAVAGIQAAQDTLNTTQSTGDGILSALSKKLKGQASAAADTFAGRTKELHAKWEDFQARIGTKIIPVIETLMDTMSDPTTFRNIGLALYVVEQDITDVGNAVLAVLNGVIRGINDVGQGINDVSPGSPFTKIPALRTFVDPTMPGSAPKSSVPKPGDKNFYGPVIDPKVKRDAELAAGMAYGAAVHHHTTIINLPAGAAPKAVAAATQRHAKRNGHKNTRQYFTSTPG